MIALSHGGDKVKALNYPPSAISIKQVKKMVKVRGVNKREKEVAMRCDICSHESTMYDFVALRNLCEHLYLDALVRKKDLPYEVSGTHRVSVVGDRQPALSGS